ncbi:hypothetical protein GCM10010345_00780 [Streptomyces canarius]|uniref:Uncharacterized protein n=1 Tax=Streptomyces canarius TaxID=285453 RepID=A0ABQ3CHS1_9ACTN|nr:hypothetical protein GCM10010345_00780 [Streptomyces canarius]
MSGTPGHRGAEVAAPAESARCGFWHARVRAAAAPLAGRLSGGPLESGTRRAGTLDRVATARAHAGPAGAFSLCGHGRAVALAEATAPGLLPELIRPEPISYPRTDA